MKVGKRKKVVADKKAIEIQDYRFKDKKRKNNPPVGGAIFDKSPQEKKKYSYDPHLDPKLEWSGKSERTSFEIDVVSLYTHERVSSKTILEAVRRKDVQKRLFSDEDVPLKDQIEYYEHDINWTNRLILGDSLLVLNSLVHRENMSNKAQCIYIDPPYGISFNSNFQPSTKKRDIKHGSDEDLTREPEQIKAYRDTWTLGIHSYLTYLRDRLLMARKLLNETGSCFVQISEENVHFVRCLMDEIFGKENFCGQIAFQKSGKSTNTSIPSVIDYIIWYARDRNKAKVNTLYRDKSENVKLMNYYNQDDGDGRKYRLSPINSQHYSKTRTVEILYKGKKYHPGKNRQWSIDPKFIPKLLDDGVLTIRGNSIFLKLYLENQPGIALNNFWDDTARGSFGESSRYVVQTTTKPVERCILMTTDPGDLVIDPTCGSATTAFVAEKFGRRWITCDTSRVSLVISRQRLIAATYPYYELEDPEIGISSGFKYQEAPHITLKTIAHNIPPEKQKLFDKPNIDSSRIRVTGPFTVESIPQYSMDNELSNSLPLVNEDNIDLGVTGVNHITTLIDLISKTGIQVAGGKKINFIRIEPVHNTGFIHAKGILKINGKNEEMAISFGPKYGPITIRQVIDAINDAIDFKQILFAGFEVEPEAQNLKDRARNKTIIFSKINPDILVGNMIKTTGNDQLFSVFGEPDIEIIKEKDSFRVKLKGVDIYNPTSGNVEPAGPEDIAAWFLDTNYDQNTSFLISQAFFPQGIDDIKNLEKTLRGLVVTEKIEKMNGLESYLFRAGEKGKVAIKVIDHRGNEVIAVKELK